MTALRFPAGGNLWRTQSDYPWTVRRNGGMIESLKVGLSEGGGERLSRSYAYNSFSDITALTEDTTSYSFAYDGLGRLTNAYGRSYSYDFGHCRLHLLDTWQWPNSQPPDLLQRPELRLRRRRALPRGRPHRQRRPLRLRRQRQHDRTQQGDLPASRRSSGTTRTRCRNCRTATATWSSSYWYDVDGARVKKTSGTTTTYTFFAHYEEEVAGGVTTTVSHYSFGGLRIAVKRGSDLYHLHGDHLGSSSLTTRGSTVEASRAYYAYGAARAAAGNLQTDRTFTGQKSDATGLMYYNARYYDPALGAFISPDFMVPDPERVINFNRVLYARGNPLRFMDPSGHCEIGHNKNGNAIITRFDCTVADFQRLS